MIKYLGSKRTLLPELLAVVERLAAAVRGAGASSRPEAPAATVADLFSGTARVGHALKGAGYRVLSNDHNVYAATLARCYVQADAEEVAEPAAALVREFKVLPGRPGYFTETFCERSRFFQPHNGARVDAIREAIAAKALPPELEAVMLVSLMEAADRVDSTTGLQMAYLKSWAKRSGNDLELRVPAVLPRAAGGKGRATCLEAVDAAAAFADPVEGGCDVVYLDPPYNQHSYLGNYHVWESLVRWDKPPVYGVACKRTDVRERKSDFNSRPRCAAAFREVLDTLHAPAVVVSFNDEGYLARPDLEAMLGALWGGRGRVTTLSHDFKRYVGAQIGIHDLNGRKVGRVGKLRNTEYIYVATREDVAACLGPLDDLTAAAIDPQKSFF
ncbi:DNA adenine methylase [Alienimonas californiensis]|uniref:site-specific DNA-methyltransferase (adenine-specific) n=1 Tax=Alienimonas californiensis TaxID=2527989 RepID=A0A517P3K8_9PLAN|nr:DNA adenine methylase [Alienimonas californiensis]QDT13953.1 Modification methylase FokI [Alienimonas californiensis]